MATGSRHSWYDFRFDWTIVDGQFLRHFLLYLNHNAQSMTNQAVADMANMARIINTKRLSHLETCLNLLGWLYKVNGLYDRAEECFHRSLEIKLNHNAAFWHICVMAFEVFSK